MDNTMKMCSRYGEASSSLFVDWNEEGMGTTGFP